MSSIINLYKNSGETPLEALNRLRDKMPEYKDQTLSYAGRLDPMAEGVLLVLVGDENKNRAAHLNNDKEYIVQILFGIETDTYDVLGKVKNICSEEKVHEVLPQKEKKSSIQNVLQKYTGIFYQKYPPYSSKPVNGKSLFEHARENEDGDEPRPTSLIIPKKEVIVYKNEFVSMKKISAHELFKYIKSKVSLVTGDFRQNDILALWKKTLSSEIENNRDFTLAEVVISCSSGTYMRSIAHDVGKDLGIGALAFKIKRIRAGEYVVNDSLVLPS
jgi:tRNA pseudouridine55 synthase